MSMEHLEQKRLGLRIKSVRVLTGLNQEEFASACGFNHTSLRNWEFGRVFPRREAINRLINAFKLYSVYVDSDWLMYGLGSGPVFTANWTNSGYSGLSATSWHEEFSSFKKTCESLGHNTFIVRINDNVMAPYYCSGDWIGAISCSLSEFRDVPEVNTVLKKPLLVKTNDVSYSLRHAFYDGETWWAKDESSHHISRIYGNTVGLVVMHISCGNNDFRPENLSQDFDMTQSVSNRC